MTGDTNFCSNVCSVGAGDSSAVISEEGTNIVRCPLIPWGTESVRGFVAICPNEREQTRDVAGREHCILDVGHFALTLGALYSESTGVENVGP